MTVIQNDVSIRRTMESLENRQTKLVLRRLEKLEEEAQEALEELEAARLSAAMALEDIEVCTRGVFETRMKSAHVLFRLRRILGVIVEVRLVLDELRGNSVNTDAQVCENKTPLLQK